MKSTKSLLILIPLLLLGIITHAQYGKLPPFQMQQADGTLFKAENLPMGKPIVLIYFSPDCDHCNNLMKELLKHTDILQKASVAMVTYLSVQEVATFSKKYNLNKYTYIYTGSEGTTYFLKNYYKLATMPFLALYTKMGDLVKTYPNEKGLTDLINRLKTLK